MVWLSVMAMQGRTPFRRVDVLAVEQRLQAFGELRDFRQLEQRIERRVVVTLAREVRVERPDAQCVAGGAGRIVGDQARERRLGQARRVGAQSIEVLLEGACVHDVLEAADEVAHREILDRVIQGVGGEVAAHRVLFDRAVDVVAQKAAAFVRFAIAAAVVGVGAEGRDFDDFAAVDHMDPMKF